MIKEDSLKVQLITLIKTINDKGLILMGDQYSPIIPSTSLDQYKLSPPELGFIRSVAWLYVLYFETGKENIKFISKKFSVYQIDEDSNTPKHLQSVNHLRTSLQHDLFADTLHNQDVKSHCKIWYLDRCDSEHPKHDTEWENCLFSLLKDATSFFIALDNCIDKLSKDEFVEVIITDWKRKLSQYHPPHEFDRIIETIASDIGRDNLDSVKFRMKNHQSWSNELALLQDYNFESEARKIIERDLLAYVKPVLPFDGKDIMEYFGIPPGKQVGDLLKLGHSILETQSYPKEQFLKVLSEEAVRKNIL